jgi:uncharacterized membrane protein YccC
MSNEEWERLKDSIRKNPTSETDQAKEKARRKMDRDLNRIERALTNVLNSESGRQRLLDERKRWREFEEQSSKRFAEISAFAARSDKKLQALIEATQNQPKKSQP